MDYQRVAEIIYAEHPDTKIPLNNSAQLIIDTLRDSLPTEMTDQDLEVICSLVAFIAADLLATTCRDVGGKINLIFDTYSLAAGACAGDIDLGDTSEARDMAAIIKEARERVQSHTDQGAVPGQYL